MFLHVVPSGVEETGHGVGGLVVVTVEAGPGVERVVRVTWGQPGLATLPTLHTVHPGPQL